MDLFDHAIDRNTHEKPFAEAVRPDTLVGFVGQADIVGPDRLLRRAIEQDRIPSVILWGPPGSGKTTLARIIARRTGSHFEPFSAVLGGVREIRAIVDAARDRRKHHRRRTILFIDEIHRFNKTQQDALLPHVEDGTVVLIGATTENPSFELTAALLSRIHVVVLSNLTPPEMRCLLNQAIEHSVRKTRWPYVEVLPEAVEYLAHSCDGDARRALSALETALDHCTKKSADASDSKPSGKEVAINPGALPIVVDRSSVAEALNRRVLSYDKAGDGHYAVISALIKSMRGSDPDAAVYWLQRMVDAGEDPLFLLRRMVVFASEDIGHADPRALQIAVSALDAFRFVGLPEGMLTLVQAATYLACAPKSNTVLTTLARARQAVKQHGSLPVPRSLQNASTALQRRLGNAQGYKYPHDFEGNYVPQAYLPDALRGTVLFRPTDSGEEADIKARLEKLRASTQGKQDA